MRSGLSVGSPTANPQIHLKLRAAKEIARKLNKQARIEVKDSSKFVMALKQNWTEWADVDL